MGVDRLHPKGVGFLLTGMTKPGYQNRIELLQGTLDMLILQTLQWGPRHGYGITQAIRTTSGDTLQVETGSLYPALHRLELRGDVKSEMTTSENNRRARVYTLTPAGRRRLSAETESFEQFTASMRRVLRAT